MPKPIITDTEHEEAPDDPTEGDPDDTKGEGDKPK